MEGTLCNISTAGIQNENLSLNQEKEDENTDKPQTEVNGGIRNDLESVVNGESPGLPDLVAQKSVSPTLIETAFKVMKNLFSPDKSKSKSTTVLSPINQSLSGSPCSGLCIQGKTEIFSSESETDGQYKAHPVSGETVFKNHSASNEIGIIQSPLTLDPHNNTDESFLTTVSLIDESFHSAITHFDDHGEALKNGVILIENILNNSQNLGLADPCNDTLENNESCLENTTLKIGSFTSEENKVNIISLQNQDESVEVLNAQKSDGIPRLNNDSKEVSEIEFQCEKFPENASNSLIQTEEVKSDVKILTKNSSVKDSSQDTDLNLSTANADNCSDIKITSESVEMSHIFLSQSFEHQMSENDIRIDDSNTSTVKQNLNEIESENETHLGNSNDERDDCVENCISTTTVVLSTVDSVDIDNMLMSLKADDSETNTSSLTSFDSDDVPCLLENLTGKIPGTDDRSLVNDKQSSENNFSALENFFPLSDDKKTCISEMNSNNKPDSTKFKLNKSDDFINRNISKEPNEKKKSSVDISLIKNIEASDISKELHPPGNASSSKTFKAFNQSEIDKSEVDLPSHKADALNVISQQSYTILTTHDNSLNRPIIEPLNISDGHFDKETFQTHQAYPTELEKFSVNNSSNVSFGSEELVKSSQVKQSTPLCEGHNDTNHKFFRSISLQLGTPDIKEFACDEKSEKSPKLNYSKADKVKQKFSHVEQAESSPINEAELNYSNSVDNEIKEDSYDAPSAKILQSRDTNEQNQSVDKQLELNEFKRLPDDVIHAMNQSFDKKPPLPHSKKDVPTSPDLRATHKLNQTFDKKSKIPARNQPFDTPGHNKLNVTFDKQPVSCKKNITKKSLSPELDRINKTFERPASPKSGQLNKTYDKPVGNQLNKSFDKKTDSFGTRMLNQTFDKKLESPQPCEITHILNKTPETSGHDHINETFCKETEIKNSCREKKGPEMKAILGNIEIDDITEVKEFDVGLESQTKGDNVLPRGNTTVGSRTATFDVLNSFPSKDKTGLEFHSPENLEKTNKNFALGCNVEEINDSIVSSKSPNTSLVCNELAAILLNENEFVGNQSTDDLSGKLGKMSLRENIEIQFDTSKMVSPEGNSSLIGSADEQNIQRKEELMNSGKDDKSTCEPDLVQLIQEQFSSNDIEKICSVVHNLSSIKLSSDILKASEQFDKSFHGNFSDSETRVKPSETETKPDVNPLSPKSFDFLGSIRGKPTGRDLSRESLYVKFDPLVQPSANSLIDFTKEGEALPTIDASPVNPHNTSVCEQLLAISPQKKPDDIVPPLTPLSHKVNTTTKEDKTERLKELQNEIYFLKNLYAERERSNKIKMEDYENQIAKLTGESCMLEDKLKESNEREKSLVKKMKEQTQSIGQLKIIMEEYVKVISKLSAELEAIKRENLKQTESLSLEKDSYMTHLQNTEAAFTDVHAKYEKSKKTIVSLKANETMFRNTIAEQTQKLEEFKIKAREAQEKALIEFQKIQETLHSTKASHSQEVARLRAQLRKTELKVEALQESLDQKIKENQQLTAICDELIEGKK